MSIGESRHAGREHAVRMASAVWEKFVLCPHDNRTLGVMPGDDKAWCGCPQSRDGTHLASRCELSSPERYVEELLSQKR